MNYAQAYERFDALFENKLLIDNFKAYATAFKDLQAAQAANTRELDTEVARLTERQNQLENSTVELTDAELKEYDVILNRISQIRRERDAIDEYVKSQQKRI